MLKFKNIKKIIIISAVFIFLLGSNFVLAEDTGFLPAGGGDCGGSNCGDYTLNEMVGVFSFYYQNVLGVIGSVALLVFIYGGAMFLISAGNSEKVTQAKQIVIGAVVGLIIVFASYMIIQFIFDAMDVKVESGGWSTSGWFK